MYALITSGTVVRHAAHVVFPEDFDGGEHVYRINLIHVQLVTDPVIMPAKEEHGCDSGSESLDKHEPRDILHCHVERRAQHFAVEETANFCLSMICSDNVEKFC
jgi:hypothetical protein